MSACSISGKALEYAYAMELIKRGIPLAEKSLTRYKSYETKCEKIALAVINSNNKSAFIVCNWLEQKNLLTNAISIHLLDDTKGKLGVVGDVIIKRESSPNVHLSIKNTKNYTKSQRPSSLATQCKFTKTNEEFKQYNVDYKNICKTFYDANKIHAKFSSIADIKTELYDPVCKLVVSFINKLDNDHTKSLYMFLASHDQYFLVFNELQRITIIDKTKKHDLPTRVKVTRNHLGYIILEFNNGFKFTLRLHTASSKITASPSLKFDTVLTNEDELYTKCVLSK